MNLPLTSICMAALAFVLSACATGNMRVTSTPDKAEVFMAYEGEQPNKIGETPLSVDAGLMGIQRGRFFQLTIKKDGFQPESILVPTSTMPASLDVTSKLSESKLPQQCIDQTASVEKIARGIATVQALMNRNSYDEARVKLVTLLNEYPSVSVLHDLMGNVNYVSRNLEAALASYQRSLSIDPSNLDTQRMVNKIKSIIGIRMPTSQEGP